MRILIFNGGDCDYVRNNVNTFLAANPQFEIVSISQSESVPNGRYNLTLTLLLRRLSTFVGTEGPGIPD